MDSRLHILDRSAGSAPADLACDEALLDACEAGEIQTQGILRFWEATDPFVVLGYGNRVADEVHLKTAAAEKIPIFRRCSGGGCVLQNAGCLNYALILPVRFHPDLTSVSQTNCFIMKRNRDAAASAIGKPVTIQGYTDLTLDGKKFSGNSQRRKSHWVLFHGTFLFDCDFALMERVLPPPPRQPDYREHRSHSGFLTCLKCSPDALKLALSEAWDANRALEAIPRSSVDRLIAEKYACDHWNFRS